MLLLLVSVWWCPAAAVAEVDVQNTLEMQGTIDIGRDGHVLDWSVPHLDQAPEGIRQLVVRTIAEWRFRPLVLPDGVDRARSAMQLRLLAIPQGAGRVSLRVTGASFGHAEEDLPFVRRRQSGMVVYPEQAARAGIEGSVRILMLIRPDGLVLQADVIQVNLFRPGSGYDMARWRKLLGRAALDAARRARFVARPGAATPTTSAFYVFLPVTFALSVASGSPSAHERQVAFGRWTTYIAGPIHRPAWAEPGIVEDLGPGPDAGRLLVLNPRISLLNSGDGAASSSGPDG
ncbi:energy transducer TonB [Frateuria aurantia]